MPLYVKLSPASYELFGVYELLVAHPTKLYPLGVLALDGDLIDMAEYVELPAVPPVVAVRVYDELRVQLKYLVTPVYEVVFVQVCDESMLDEEVV